MTNSEVLVVQRERWLPLAQNFFAAQKSRFPGVQIEMFVDEVFAYISPAACIKQALALQIVEHYYEDGPLVKLLRSQPQGEQWLGIVKTIRQYLIQIGVSEHELDMVVDRTIARVSRSVQNHQFQTSFATLVTNSIRREL